MYSIPKDFDLNCLLNINIIQVCFSINTISIHFEKIGFIQIEGGFSFLYNDIKNDYENISSAINSSEILILLEKTFIAVNANESRTNLKLEFEGGVLELFGKKNYESYTLNINGGKNIV